MSKIARRQFIQLSAVAAAGTLLRPGQEAQAQDMPKVEESDAMAQAMKYTHDASTIDAAARANPAPEQTCSNCALVQGEDGAEWRVGRGEERTALRRLFRSAQRSALQVPRRLAHGE